MNGSRNFDYVIVGSGPSALAAIRRLPKGKDIIVIDRGRKEPEGVKAAQNQFLQADSIGVKSGLKKHDALRQKSSFKVKLYWGSDYPYKDVHNFAPAESQSQGGFTVVWGATCFPANKTLIGKLNLKLREEYVNTISELEKVIDVAWSQENTICYSPCSTVNDFLKERNSFLFSLGKSGNIVRSDFGLYWEQTRLAVSEPKVSRDPTGKIGCVNCGLCQVGCPYGITWNSWDRFQNEISRLTALYEIGDVYSIKEKDDRAIVHYFANGILQSISAKRVLLTGGVLSSSRILIQSDKISKTKIRDSQTVAFVGFTPISRKLDHNYDNVSFPEMSFLFQTKTSEMSLQIYAFNKYMAERISPKLAEILFNNRFLHRLFCRFFFVGLGYLDSDISGSLIVSNSGIKIQYGNAREIRKLFRNTRKKMKLLSLYILPLYRRMTVGGGYHFMGNFFTAGMWDDEVALERKGMLKLTTLASISENSRVHIVDGSIQGHLPTGSVTLNSMAITTIIVNRIVECDKSLDEQRQIRKMRTE